MSQSRQYLIYVLINLNGDTTHWVYTFVAEYSNLFEKMQSSLWGLRVKQSMLRLCEQPTQWQLLLKLLPSSELSSTINSS